MSGIAACVALAACAGPSSETPGGYAGAAPKGPDVVHQDPVPDSLLKKVLADAARRAGADASKLEVVSTQKLTWNDGSLGCPKPDRMYTQALVPGYRIWVRYADTLFDYHASEGDAFFLCESAAPHPNDPVAR